MEMNKELNSVKTENFSSAYKEILTHLISNGNEYATRDGNTIELLNFKTILTNPINRCVMGCDRNVNIFFLIYEALWIWGGKKDVESLCIFNEGMKNYSDDGVVFHAPYGYRLRHFGNPTNTDTFIKQCKEQNSEYRLNFISKDNNEGIDQIRECILALSKNDLDRKVVASIWNPILDLNFKTKDTPCNDMLMFKIRDEQLHLTIQNRSNDLHWGLLTNVFQFSFILELMALALGVGIGTQTHNSQSLHVYMENPISLRMINKKYTHPHMIHDDSEFAEIVNGETDVLKRLQSIDELVEKILSSVIDYNNGKISSIKDNVGCVDGIGSLQAQTFMFLLQVYIDYKKSNKKIDDKIRAFDVISNFEKVHKFSSYTILGKSFFAHRIPSNEYKKYRL